MSVITRRFLKDPNTSEFIIPFGLSDCGSTGGLISPSFFDSEWPSAEAHGIAGGPEIFRRYDGWYQFLITPG